MKAKRGISPTQANLLLLLASLIWGLSFVAQRLGMEHVGPLTFNGIRFLLGAVVLVPVAVLGLPGQARSRPTAMSRNQLRDSVLAGLVLFVAATLQQYGVVFTSAGEAGFITSLYVVFVPILGLAIGHRAGRAIWLGVGLSAVGLYLLSAKGPLGIGLGNGLVLIGAVFWALHVQVIGRLARTVPPLSLAVTQFAVVAILSLLGAVGLEEIVLAELRAAAAPILYAGILSVAVAYTLQVVGQTRARPAPAAIILSMESVFAALGGWLILSEVLSLRALLGCGLMLAGVIASQFEPPDQEPRRDEVVEA